MTEAEIFKKKITDNLIVISDKVTLRIIIKKTQQLII